MTTDMKNILKSILVLLCGVCAFTACDEDRDSNPTLQKPTTFKLNTPAYAAQSIDLEHSDSLHFTWSQPDYGFPAAAQYQIQFSMTDTYTVSTDEATADETGSLTADYMIADNVFTTCIGNVEAESVAKGLVQIAGWTEDEVPATQKVYARVMSVLASDTIYSNSVEFNVIPYYIELKDADPEIWYLIGGCIGDGAWTNSADAVGTSMIPMFTKEGVEYDSKTGQGEIEYIGYFPADAAFKIIKTLGSWDYGFCGGDAAGTTSYRDGGDDPGNITLPSAGYYKITVDTKNITCTIEEYSGTPSVYSSMFLPGDHNNWDQTAAMTAVETVSGAENHIWKADVTFTGTGGFKFTDTSTWWGGDAFPYGTASTSGGNIPYTEGSYQVFFNDINGAYYFFSK